VRAARPRAEPRFSARVAAWLEARWYAESVTPALVPLEYLYRGIVALRASAYRRGWLRRETVGVPVVIVGNLTVGGTGKTPLVVWMAQELTRAGYRPGIVTRGYGGRSGVPPRPVSPGDDPAVVGDEALLIARRTSCPVVVGRDRVAAARRLVEHDGCRLVISDDGLQHLRLARAVELVVVDGERRFGNGHCLPAGPLREPVDRLENVDAVITNGARGMLGELRMVLSPGPLRAVGDPDRALAAETLRPRRVYAVAGIGNPERFFTGLRRLGFDPIERRFPDHHPFTASDLVFDEPELPVLMTEKDAVKCAHLNPPANWWYLPVDAEPEPALLARVLERLEAHAGDGRVGVAAEAVQSPRTSATDTD